MSLSARIPHAAEPSIGPTAAGFISGKKRRAGNVKAVRSSQDIVADIEKLLSKARPVPLTNQVRLERDKLEKLLQELRESLAVGR